MDVDLAAVLLLAAAGVHAGFQATVSTLVYPALLEAEPFAEAHRRHTRRITPLVVVVYGGLVVAGALRLLAGALDVASWVALGALGVAAAVTASVAAPTHGRLGAGRTDALARRLVRADLARTAASVVALVAAALALR